MQKQALMHNRDPTEPRFLATTVLLSLCGGQRPLVQTMYQRVTSHINTAPIGFNAKVAIMAKGWNQEDSVVLNADSTQVRLRTFILFLCFPVSEFWYSSTPCITMFHEHLFVSRHENIITTTPRGILVVCSYNVNRDARRTIAPQLVEVVGPRN